MSIFGSPFNKVDYSINSSMYTNNPASGNNMMASSSSGSERKPGISSSGSNIKMSLRILVDVKRNRIVFAEAGTDFVNFLFQLMTLPLSTITKLLNDRLGMVGSIGALYKSIESLHGDYFKPEANKDSVLKPRDDDVSVPLLSLNKTPRQPPIIYTCGYHASYYSDRPGLLCPTCRRPMNSVNPNNVNIINNYDPSKTKLDSGYLKTAVNYIVMDNLEVRPMSIHLIRFLVRDLDYLEEKQVDVGVQEGLALLKASLESQDVLSTVFLHNKVRKRN